MKSEERFHWGNSMLDIEEFKKKKQSLFETRNQIYTLTDLESYFSDLQLVCLNESSSNLVSLFPSLIKKAKKIGNDDILFKLYWLYFRQIYYFKQSRKKTEELMKLMQKIATRSNNIEHKTIVLTSKSLYNQFMGDFEKAIMLISKALKLLDPEKEAYSETYHNVLCSYSFFSSFKKQEHSEIIENMEKCLSFFHKGYNTLGLIKVIFHSLRYYTFAGLDSKYEELIHWIFSVEKIQNKIIDSQYIFLYASLGKFSTIRENIDEAINYLLKSYNRIKAKNMQIEVMFFFTDILLFLSRSYAYQGQFEEAYNLLVELIDFIETKFIRENYMAKRIRLIYFKSYFTLLFIYAQLDLDFSTLQDDKLKRIYDYTKSLLTDSRISEEVLLDTSLDEHEMKKILEGEFGKSKDEAYLALHQLFLTQEPFKISTEAATTIRLAKDYAFNPIYADILLGKIYLAKSQFEEFHKIVRRIELERKKVKKLILQIWIDFFILMSRYLRKPDNVNISYELDELDELCVNNNFMKISNEIKFYHKLISSTKTIKNLEDKFKTAAFIDILNIESKEIVMEYLKN